MNDFKVIIIGAGLGGLVLAQSLRHSSVAFELFERDSSPWDRPQGYRLHLEGDALNAAREVLSPDVHRVLELTAQRTAPFTSLLDTHLDVLKRIPTEDGSERSVWPDTAEQNVHCNVDRATLRQLLLAGLDGICHYGKHLERYETSAHGVKAFFSDGTSAEGDVLVGADGVRSAVRKQRAPRAHIMDAGIRAIYGRIPMEAARAAVPPTVLTDIFTIAIDARKLFFAMGSVIFPTPPDRAAAQSAGIVELLPQRDYVVCIIGGRDELFPQRSDALRSMASNELGEIARDMLQQWPERAASIVGLADTSAFFFVEMSTSIPCTLDLPTNVTLLGGRDSRNDANAGTRRKSGNARWRSARPAVGSGRPGENARWAQRSATMKQRCCVMVLLWFANRSEIGQQRAGQNPLPRELEVRQQ